ncbi:trans-sialidase, putative, partial [Trypanosoma cruzi marinkellei]
DHLTWHGGIRAAVVQTHRKGTIPIDFGHQTANYGARTLCARRAGSGSPSEAGEQHTKPGNAKKGKEDAETAQHSETSQQNEQSGSPHATQKYATTPLSAAKDTIKIHRVTPTEASCGPTERREAQEKGASSKHKRVDGKKHTITHHRALNKNKNKNRSITSRQRRGSLVETLVRVQKVILFPLPSLLVCLSSIHFSLGRGTSVRPHTQRGSRCTHAFIAPAPPLTALGYTG